MPNEQKLTYILVVVVGLLALVAIIVSAVALSNGQSNVTVYNSPSAAGGSGNGQGAAQSAALSPVSISGPMAGPVQSKYQPSIGSAGRIFSITIGHDYGSHEYFDRAGYLTGFGVGLIDEVCTAAEMDCRITWDLYINCWDSKVGQHATGGQGLHGRWYDACAGWYVTVERTHVFQFGLPYLQVPATHFYVLKGKSFDTAKESIMRSKILFLDGWASDEKCMARETGAIMNPPDISYVPTADEAMKLLEAGTYNAIFTTANTLSAQLNNDKVEEAGPAFSCMVSGNTIMARKDNDVTVHWNRGFMKLKNSGRFKSYCAKANKDHADRGSLQCIDSF